MDSDKKTILLRYVIAFCVAIVLCVLALAIQGFFQEDTKENMKILHNTFFASGVFMMLFQGIIYVSGEGAFLGIGYALGRAFRALIPFSRKPHETYAEYRERKTSKKKEKGGYATLIIGFVFFLISLIFLWIWYVV